MEDIRFEHIQTIVNLLKSSPYVEGIILVGSGVGGFPDDFADIDMSIVINPEKHTEEVWKSFNRDIYDKLGVFFMYENVYGENNYLTLLFLKDFLEIDIGFISLTNLVAKKKDWEILFDKTSLVKDKMYTTWKSDDKPNTKIVAKEVKVTLLYHLRNICVAYNRNKPLEFSKRLKTYVMM